MPIGPRIVNEEVLQKAFDDTRRLALQLQALSSRAQQGAGNLDEETLTRAGYKDVPSRRDGNNTTRIMIMLI
jgi:hypothetical protein